MKLTSARSTPVTVSLLTIYMKWYSDEFDSFGAIVKEPACVHAHDALRRHLVLMNFNMRIAHLSSRPFYCLDTQQRVSQ